MTSTPVPNSSTEPLIDADKDDLNNQFERAETLEEVTGLYLQKADLFHIDQTSGGKRENTEQFIKLLIALAAPDAF